MPEVDLEALAAVRTVAGGGFAPSSQLEDILQGELARVPTAADVAADTLRSPAGRRRRST